MTDEGVDWSIGSLPRELFGMVETILAQKQLLYPIVTGEEIDVAARSILTTLDGNATHSIASFRQHFSIQADIYHCYIATTKFNAFAAHSSSEPAKYYIGINLGTTLIALLIDPLLRKPQIRALLELHPLEDVDDKQLKREIGALATFTFQWIIWHELGHIVNGHLHLASIGYVRTEGAEEKPNSKDSNLTGHTLEMDADSFANARTFETLFRLPMERLPFESMHTTKGKIRAFAVGVYGILRRLDKAAWNLDDPFNLSHPSASLRMANIASWGGDYADRRKDLVGDLSAEEWVTEAAGAMLAADSALIEIGLTPPPPGVADWWKANNVKHVEQLLARWAKIRPSLEPHVLGAGRILPIAQADPA